MDQFANFLLKKHSIQQSYGSDEDENDEDY